MSAVHPIGTVTADAPAARSSGELTGLPLMAHLFRRAGFGATRDELERAVTRGYDAVVDDVLSADALPDVDHDLVDRFCPDVVGPNRIGALQGYWLYLMINSRRQLAEKMALFWHQLFATAYSKGANSPSMLVQLEMFRANALANFRTILLKLSQDPAMIVWLDNQENTKTVHNENYGRELLELFAMGIGNYTEDDVKSSARAFTGWGLESPICRGPYGHYSWRYAFHPDQHDDTEKAFLGVTGAFDGADVIDIIVKHPATARFVARRLFLFFVSDTPDEAAIEELADVFRRSDGEIRAVVRAIFLSRAFRSRRAYFAKVKSPVEHVVGLARFAGTYAFPDWSLIDLAVACTFASQELLNPPSVEGWHTGKEWISTGTLVQRVNFGTAMITDGPGVRSVIDRVRAMGPLTPERTVDVCADLMGPLELAPPTRAGLVEAARKHGTLDLGAGGREAEERVKALLRLIVATREYQLC